MMLSFDVDCGELVPGHRLIARGLRSSGLMSCPGWDDSDEEVSAFSFEYELVPGVRADEFRSAFGYIVGIYFDADVPLPWEPSDSGAIAPANGGASTHGSRGDWPLPDGARVLTFTMVAVTPAGWQAEEPSGELVVDLVDRSARWVPA
jgi:hypothetical protein